jgi:hypothetical protein
MACNIIKFSAHGLIKLTIRKIDVEDVLEVVHKGNIIFEYPKDKPFPSRLILGWIKNRQEKALHVVVAEDTTNNICIVVTAYWPDENMWQNDFKTKK